jgi:hypothetical protein
MDHRLVHFFTYAKVNNPWRGGTAAPGRVSFPLVLLGTAGDICRGIAALLSAHIFIPVWREPRYNTTYVLLFPETGDKEA